MTEGKLESQWNHTCSIVATIANVNLPKHQQFKPESIHPMRVAEKKRQQQSVKHPVQILQAFLPKSEQMRLKRGNPKR